MKAKKRKPVLYWHFVSWYCFSLGITIDLESPNIEVHLPFGFFRAGIQIVEYEPQLTFLESLVLDMNKRLIGVESYICKQRINAELDK